MKYALRAACFCFVAAIAAPVDAQTWAIEVAGGSTTPVSDIGSRLSTGWNFNFAAGRQFNDWFALMGEFGYGVMPVPQSVLDQFQAPNGRGDILTIGIDPEVRFPLSGRVRGFVMGGVDLAHRVIDLTAPSIQYADYYDPFYGDLGPTPIEGENVISHVSRTAIGENFGAGVAYPLQAIGAELFAGVRYFRAPTVPSKTVTVPVMFGLRWTGRR